LSNFDKEHRQKELKDHFLRIEFFENNSNYGVYTSRDELLKKVSSDAKFVCSIDDDIILPPNLFKGLVPICFKDESIGIIGPRVVYDDYQSETAHGAGFVNWWLGRYTTKDWQAAIECDYVIGCCMLINKQVVDEIGGFDRDYYTSHGEVDFCLRAKKKGFKVVYDPSVIVRHRVDKGGTRNLERLYYVYRNKLLVIKKNWPVPKKWVALFIYSLLWFPKAIIDSLIINKKVNSREIKTIIKSMRDGWSNRFGKRM
jgi:GT2 family glycosyltransferase